MDTSDDPIFSVLFGDPDKRARFLQAPPADQQAKRTAEPVEQLSEQAKRNKRLAASLLTKDWGKPKLGTAGLLGM